MSEPFIVINGQPLTTAQAMTVRVAIASMLIELADPEHLAALGPIGPAYRDRASEVSTIIHRKAGT